MTTNFYSTKLNKNVAIPDNKVCGYRFGNIATKKGYSSGVRAGKNNGVVDQKLSRFAYDWEAEQKYPCAGNQNWLNKNQRINFTKTTKGKPFQIQRPAFYSKTETQPDPDVSRLKKNEREGLGNRNITRNNFIAPPIKGRVVLPFEQLQALDIAKAGQKIQLSEKTLKQLFKIQIDDPTDIKWINEKNRRLRAGETERQINMRLPFGRPQRKISKMVNFAAQGLSIDDKMEAIKAGLLQGNISNVQLISQTALALDNIENVKKISQTGLNDLQKIIDRLNVTKNWKQMFGHRIFSYYQYKEQTGLVNLFLLSNLSNLRGERTMDKPLLLKKLNEAKYISINNIERNLRPTKLFSSGKIVPSKYIDLQERSIINLNEAVELVNAGIDAGQLDGINPPEGPPNYGKWLSNIVPYYDVPNVETLEDAKEILEPPTGNNQFYTFDGQDIQGLPEPVMEEDEEKIDDDDFEGDDDEGDEGDEGDEEEFIWQLNPKV